MDNHEFIPTLVPGSPEFIDLPWEKPLDEWQNNVPGLEEVQRGISRHPVVFINVRGTLYAIKEMPEDNGKKEFLLLSEMSEAKLPSVLPIGYALIRRETTITSILFTRYLDTSIPYRSLFMSRAIEKNFDHLLNAIAGLLMQIHINGFFWGDCSLSNILFRRDAGALQAYLVDAETAEHHLPSLSPMLRFHDLEIMEENILGELSDLQEIDHIPFTFPIEETGSSIQHRYQSLWEEITREVTFHPNESYRIEERIRALNALGFSVKDIELKSVDNGNIMKLRIFVSDRNFHRDQLLELTGLYAEEHQAQQIINEIYELKANISQSQNPNISLEAVAFHWLKYVYQPVALKLQPMMDANSQIGASTNAVELYCQVLEHKWYLSEAAKHDVGHQIAVEDFINKFK